MCTIESVFCNSWERRRTHISVVRPYSVSSRKSPFFLIRLMFLCLYIYLLFVEITNYLHPASVMAVNPTSVNINGACDQAVSVLESALEVCSELLEVWHLYMYFWSSVLFHPEHSDQLRNHPSEISRLVQTILPKYNHIRKVYTLMLFVKEFCLKSFHKWSEMFVRLKPNTASEHRGLYIGFCGWH